MAFALVDHATSSAGAASAGINTSLANFLVCGVAAANPPSAPTDSKGNTWLARTLQSGASAGAIRLYYAFNPTVGAGHTFTANGSLPSGCFAAFSGATITDPFDGDSAGASQAAGTGGQPGSLTPSAINGLVVVIWGDVQGSAPVITLPGYTTTDNLNVVGGTSYGSGLAFLIQTTVTAVNPALTNTDCQIQTAFLAATGGPPAGPTYPQLERGIRGLARGVAGGIARSFVRKDRIFVPAYATYDLKAAA